MTAKPDTQKIQDLHFQGDTDTIRIIGGAAPDYFELFGLPRVLSIDLDALRDAFLDLSRKFHPDYFATEDPALREESLRRSSLLNNAHKTLRDPQLRAEYLIEISGFEIQSNKNAIPPELLEEIFDIQEAGEELREARLNADADALKSAEERVRPLREQAQGARNGLKENLENQFRLYDQLAANNANNDDRKNKLQEIRLTLDRMNYLRTVLRNLR